MALVASSNYLSRFLLPPAELIITSGRSSMTFMAGALVLSKRLLLLAPQNILHTYRIKIVGKDSLYALIFSADLTCTNAGFRHRAQSSLPPPLPAGDRIQYGSFGTGDDYHVTRHWYSSDVCRGFRNGRDKVLFQEGIKSASGLQTRLILPYLLSWSYSRGLVRGSNSSAVRIVLYLLAIRSLIIRPIASAAHEKASTCYFRSLLIEIFDTLRHFMTFSSFAPVAREQPLPDADDMSAPLTEKFQWWDDSDVHCQFLHTITAFNVQDENFPEEEMATTPAKREGRGRSIMADIPEIHFVARDLHNRTAPLTQAPEPSSFRFMGTLSLDAPDRHYLRRTIRSATMSVLNASL
ncbi:uncharacterized protein BT62DRAFT_1077586 [Guyanagaster necrorhizus]|uniref:Uncharacterized protein n=1 Tax=Guyanagaster necrorhizus TaxID=856835 RepID=A0A9P7VRV9_9AGAR|nr:uncharacterized protein BT62DRAFT_1077586 [Guyanagaster necrorhizus MCA 3950]KAG7444836.1 hypothetical protein BT62DRAFT_1077586 [Guyanagaster necrorhizus MCA 3950]